MTSPIPPSLEEVANAFARWRATAPKGRQTPKTLRQQVVALLPHYPISQICHTLSINHNQIRLWQERSSEESPRPLNEAPTFVALEPLSGTDAAHPPLTLTWSTHTAQGLPMSVTGTLPLEQWRAVLPLLNGTGG